LPDTYAADLLSAVVGQAGSRFQRDLVDSGACVRADFSWETQAHVGPIAYGLEAAPDRVDACVEAALRELPRLADGEAYTDEELRNGATQLEVRKALEREATSAFAHLLTFYWSTTGLPYYDGYLDQLRAVRREQIGAFLKRYVLGPGEGVGPRPPFVFGALVSPELSASAHLDAAHFERLLGLEPPKAPPHPPRKGRAP
jgi:predicted Zn-dependent peptidase